MLLDKVNNFACSRVLHVALGKRKAVRFRQFSLVRNVIFVLLGVFLQFRHHRLQVKQQIVDARE